MKPTAPVNISTMNVDEYVKKHFCQPVTSMLMYEPSSTAFHPYGLYSEQIFGQVGSLDRLSRLGYIDLHTEVFAPIVYKNIIDVVPYYQDLMQGTIYCTWNTKEKRFDIVPKGTLDSDTGFSYFVSHVKECLFVRNASLSRTNKIRVIEQAFETNTALISKMLVCPAGWRDVRIDETGHIETEEVNKLYNSLLAISGEISTFGTMSPLISTFTNSMRYNIQLKCYDIYAHWKNVTEGKGGFGQSHYTKRAIAGGTRNVVTTPDLTATSPDAPNYLKAGELLVPLYEAAKAFELVVINRLNTVFYASIYTMGSTSISVIDPKTLQLTYVEVSTADVSEALGSDAKTKFIMNFADTKGRYMPVTVKSLEGKSYYLWMVYDLGDQVYVFRSLNDLAILLGVQESTVIDLQKDDSEIRAKIDLTKVRPLTKIEMLYLATQSAAGGKYGILTRYPAIEVGSVVPCKIVVSSTSPDRIVQFKSQYNTEASVTLPHYPVIGAKDFIDSLVVHPSLTPGLGMDFDGDTASFNGILTTEATNEIAEYMQSPNSLVTTTGKMLSTADTAETSLVVYAMTRYPEGVTLPIAEA